MTRYYVVGVRKLAVLSLCTFGLYGLYWFYQQWRAYRDATGEVLSPGWRAVFSQIFSYFLFEKIKHELETDGEQPAFSPGFYAILYFILTSSWRLPAPWKLIALLWFLPIVPVQAAINANLRRHDPEANLNETWEWWGFLLAAVGTVLLLIFVIGTLLPPEEA
jgi:hypothetical protein